MTDKMTVWAWHCGKPQYGYLFHNGNDYARIPYQFGGVMNLAYGGRLISAETRQGLVLGEVGKEWNKTFPKFRVKPVRVTVAIERVTKAKGGVK